MRRPGVGWLGCAALSLAAPGCDDGGKPADAAPVEATVATATLASPADSLVLTLGDGGTVWYTFARDARAADGSACVERGLEIRRDGARAAVPLLYTRDLPIVADDTTIEARLYLNCAAGDRYRIDARTGQPTPIR